MTATQNVLLVIALVAVAAFVVVKFSRDESRDAGGGGAGGGGEMAKDPTGQLGGFSLYQGGMLNQSPATNWPMP